MKAKQLRKGLIQLTEEGAVQVFRPLETSEYILGAVGNLQFDVTSARLKDEYGADTVYEPAKYVTARWVECGNQKHFKEFEQDNGGHLARDAGGNLTFLAPSAWHLERCMEQWPEIIFNKTREHN